MFETTNRKRPILYKSTNQEVLSISNPMEQSTKERRLGKKTMDSGSETQLIGEQQRCG